MSIFTQWLSSKRTAFRERRARAKQESLEHLGYTTINVVEFDGKLYVSYNGIPIVPASSLTVEIEKAVSESRVSFLKWKNKFAK